MYYNTEELINTLTGKNKSFIKQVAKHQEERYGNVDIFSAHIHETGNVRGQCVTMQFGDYWIEFYIADNKVYDTYGNGQGHRYHKSLESCAIELFQKNYNQSKLYGGYLQ